MIKKTSKTSVFILLLLFGYKFVMGQTDTTRYPIFNITLESGVFFPQNQNLKDTYRSKSNFYWGLGTQFGTSDWRLIPWIKFSQQQAKIDSTFKKNDTEYNEVTAKKNQLSFGIINPINISNNHYLQLKLGMSYNFIMEDVTGLYSEQVGLLMSVGYMNKLSKYVSYYTDFGYDYTNTNDGSYFKDWSGLIINFGVCFNIGADEPLN